MPQDSNSKTVDLGDFIQFTPANDFLDASDVIGVVDDIQDPNPTTGGLVHATYMAPDTVGGAGEARQTGVNKWGEWFDPTNGTIIIRANGSAP